MTSRREFLERAALSAAATSLGLPTLGEETEASHPSVPRGFLDLLRSPDAVVVQTASGDRRLSQGTSGRWMSDSIVVTAAQQQNALHITLTAPNVAVLRVHL